MIAGDQFKHSMPKSSSKRLAGFLCALWAMAITSITTPAVSQVFRVSDFGAAADGLTDDTLAFQKCFDEVSKAGGGTVIVPPGSYFMAGRISVRLPSNVTVVAHGSRFLLPGTLSNGTRLTLFNGENNQNFDWTGGKFEGNCFDPNSPDIGWPPNVSTRVFAFTTTRAGVTQRLRFKHIVAEQIAGAVVTVMGFQKAGSETEIENYAKNIAIEDCILLNCGQFMWDYGYLWELTTWPNDYPETERALGARFFPSDLIQPNVKFDPVSTRVLLDNRSNIFRVSADESPQYQISFFGDVMPANIKRGKAYYIVDAGADFIRISDRARGSPLVTGATGAETVSVVRDLFNAYWQLYIPTGSSDGKGAVDLRGCSQVRLLNNVLSSRGDAMHIQRCRENLVENNFISSARMGALFIAEFCQDTLVKGNIVNGNRGSRVASIEKGNQRVRIINNTFLNGGRGSWINQPHDIVIEGNSFLNNTKKGEPLSGRGRRTASTGAFEAWSEVYFTLYESAGAYAKVIIRDNVFDTGIEALDAINFGPNGSSITISDNIFKGYKRAITIDPSCSGIVGAGNVGLDGKLFE